MTGRFNDPGSLIRVRIGIHIGETVQEADFFGHAVSYAERIANQATGGEVEVSSLVHGLRPVRSEPSRRASLRPGAGVDVHGREPD